MTPYLFHAGTMSPEERQRFAGFALAPLDRETPARPPYLVLREGRCGVVYDGARPPFLPPAFDPRQASAQSLLARAVGLHVRPSKRILDAMAGWGSDGLELAALGARVTMVEASMLVWALLRERIEASAVVVEALVHGSAAGVMATGTWDVIYLDPMFPGRGRKGLAKLPMQVLRAIVDDSVDAPMSLLDTARRHASERVVVKRRRTDPMLGRPDWQLKGTTVRFDVYRGTACHTTE
ncbi:MAG: class I SAM-dependent methyltransferase [Pseudomonadales bacterium]